MGTIFFYGMYVLIGLCVYTLLRGTYVRVAENPNSYYNKNWKETDERYKRPLWFILGVIILWLIPIFNVTIPISMIMHYIVEDDRNYYYKSFLTKKY